MIKHFKAVCTTTVNDTVVLKTVYGYTGKGMPKHYCMGFINSYLRQSVDWVLDIDFQWLTSNQYFEEFILDDWNAGRYHDDEDALYIPRVVSLSK